MAGRRRDRDAAEKLCRQVADACRNSATNIEYTKLSIIAALIILAAQIALLVASAVGTLGSSTAGIPIASAATRVIVSHPGRRDRGHRGRPRRRSGDGGQHPRREPADHHADQRGRGNGDQAGSRWLSRGVANTIGANSADFGSAAARGAAQGAIAGASGNVANDFVNGKRGSDLLGSAIAGGSTGSAGGALGGMSTRHEGLVDAHHPGGQGLGYRVDGGPRHRTSPEGLGSGWNSNGAQHLGNTAGNNGNDKSDDHPKLQYRP